MHSQILRKPVFGATLALATIVGGAAIAQNLPALSCGQLWYERNSIYSQFSCAFQAIPTPHSMSPHQPWHRAGEQQACS
jgi:hypothetical protein